MVATLLAQHRHEALRELRLVLLEPALFYAALILTPLEGRERRRVLDFWLASAVAIAVIASIPPVRRATRIDPAIVLREE